MKEKIKDAAITIIAVTGSIITVTVSMPFIALYSFCAAQLNKRKNKKE